LSGCGSGPNHRAAPPPKLPQAVASSLAAHSDEVARALEAGDSCRAASLARQLQHQTIAAINARRVPAAFQEEIAATANDLVGRIRCVPVQQPQKGSGKHKGKKKHGKEKD
jgi:hypothetical protein